MKPLTTRQLTICGAILFALFCWSSNDDYKNQVYVADIIRDSTNEALVAQDKDEWNRHVQWGEDTLAMGEVK